MDSRTLLSDFSQAVGQLHSALSMPAENDVLKAGCIQYFEFCFELSWKTIRGFAHDEGINDCNSPKSALKVAFANGWIDDEETWLKMLSARNRMSHTYNAKDALTIFDELPAALIAFSHLVAKLESLPT